MKIGVFDSGIGGLTILQELLNVLPNEDYLYYQDSLNNPYGDKDDDTLRVIVSKIVDYLKGEGCKVIVVACNTATTRCISYLRDKYKDLIFIGTEPAVKVACDKGYDNILVMATPATIASERLSVLVANNKKEKEKIYLVGCSGLASAIENNDVKRQEEIIRDIYNKYALKDIKAIVLGCTHYPLIKDNLKRVLGDVKFFDGFVGVSKELARQLELKSITFDKNNRTSFDFINTSSDSNKNIRFMELMNSSDN